MVVSDNTVDRNVQVQSVLKACMFTDLEEKIVNLCNDFEVKILGEEAGQLLEKHKNCNVFIEGVEKYRQVFKRRLRGVYYLTPKVLLEANKVADQQLQEFLEESALREQQKSQVEGLLATQVELDRKWIEKINGSRRDIYLSAIKSEVLQACQVKMKKEYGNIYSDLEQYKIMFIEENALSLQLDGWREHFLKDFEKQIPFSEDEDPISISKLSTDLTASLNFQVLDPLVLKNSEKLQHLREQLNETIDKSVVKYTQEMKKGLKKLIIAKAQAISKLHKTTMQKFLPSRDNFEELVGFDDKVEPITKYQDKCVKQLEKLLQEKSVLARKNLEGFQTDLTTELATFLNHFKTISKKCKSILPTNCGNKMKDAVETCLDDIITLSTEATNEHAVEAVMNLIKNHQSTSSKVKSSSVNVSNKDVCNIISKLENSYTERLTMILKTNCGLVHLQRFHKFETEFMLQTFENQFQGQNFEEKLESNGLEQLSSGLRNFADEHFKQVVGLVCASKKGRISSVVSTVPPTTSNYLTPIGITLSPSGIQMATTDDCFVLKNEFGEVKTMSRVGYTKEGQFIYGEDLTHQLNLKNENADACDLLHHWNLFEYETSMSNKPRLCKVCPDIAKIGEKEEKISGEFLLAFLLRKLKDSADNEMEQCSKTVVITVPFYLCSADRIRVKDAAKLAQFSEVILVNDCAASLYACWPSNCQYAVVFSQSANQTVNLFLYKGDRLNDGIDNMLVDNPEVFKMQQFRTIHLKKANGCEMTEKWIMEKAYEKLVENIVKPLVKVGMIVTWEDEDSRTTKILGEFYRQLLSGSEDNEGRDLVLHGTAQLTTKIGCIGTRIQDQMSHDIYVDGAKFRAGILLSKGNILEKSAIGSLRLGASRVLICNGKEVGSLFLSGIGRCGLIMEFKFGINNEGIVFLRGVQSKMETEIFSDVWTSCVEWESANFTQKEIECQWKLLNFVCRGDVVLNDTLSSFETVCTTGCGGGPPIATSAELK